MPVNTRRKHSGSNSAVECQLPKLDVAGSIPVSRSSSPRFTVKSSFQSKLMTTMRNRMRVALLFLGIVLVLFAPESWAQTTPTRQVPVDSLIYDLKNPDPVRRKEAATL